MNRALGKHLGRVVTWIKLVVENLDLIYRSFEKSTKVEDDDGVDTKLDQSMLIDFYCL